MIAQHIKVLRHDRGFCNKSLCCSIMFYALHCYFLPSVVSHHDIWNNRHTFALNMSEPVFLCWVKCNRNNMRYNNTRSCYLPPNSPFPITCCNFSSFLFIDHPPVGKLKRQKCAVETRWTLKVYAVIDEKLRLTPGKLVLSGHSPFLQFWFDKLGAQTIGVFGVVLDTMKNRRCVKMHILKTYRYSTICLKTVQRQTSSLNFQHMQLKCQKQQRGRSKILQKQNILAQQIGFLLNSWPAGDNLLIFHILVT